LNNPRERQVVVFMESWLKTSVQNWSAKRHWFNVWVDVRHCPRQLQVTVAELKDGS
jgi:hypothetical protein